MKLIAKMPCSFGGRRFYIGDEIPEGLVAEPVVQEKLGVLSVIDAGGGQAGILSAMMFSQKEVDAMIADAVAEAEKSNEEKLTELQGYVKELQEAEPEVYEKMVQISVKSKSDGENEQVTAISASLEEIQQVFSVLQMNAEEGAKAIAGIVSENVLILLHAADSRKTIKNAAKEQADKLFHTEGDSNESTGGNAATGTDTEEADT